MTAGSSEELSGGSSDTVLAVTQAGKTDSSSRPITSGKTVWQVSPQAIMVPDDDVPSSQREFCE